MKKWEGGDPGVLNQKTPTTVLLTPDQSFHSLGFTARDAYHDLDPIEASKWLYFDRFKMTLHSDQTLTRETMLEACNGHKVPALKIFSHALSYFRDHALRELTEHTGVPVEDEDIRWVLTVPAIWSYPAKQFMRTAAYQAGMGNPSRPDHLLIALEPEAAAIYCRKLRRHQLLPERPLDFSNRRNSLHSTHPSTPKGRPTSAVVSSGSLSLRSGLNTTREESFSLPHLGADKFSSLPYNCNYERVSDWFYQDTVYMVVDCGGGTVDITVHQMTNRKSGHLKELHKASGGPFGSTGVDQEFMNLLNTIFGDDFISDFQRLRPAAFVDLMIAFESRKRSASPYKSSPLNIALPFSFIDLYKKTKGKEVENAIRRHSSLGVRWSSQGMLRLEMEVMTRLFASTLLAISQCVENVLLSPDVSGLQYMFLVGGFCESELLQKHMRDTFGDRVNVIIPQGMGLAILRGAVQFGLDPSVVTVRRARETYGVGILNRFDSSQHSLDKRVVAAGEEWCADVLDTFVSVDESVAIGDVITRAYTPATPMQHSVVLHLYATLVHDAKYVTDEGVRRVGTLNLELLPVGAGVSTLAIKGKDEEKPAEGVATKREITVHMRFGDTEVKATAVDNKTGQSVRAVFDFLAS